LNDSGQFRYCLQRSLKAKQKVNNRGHSRTCEAMCSCAAAKLKHQGAGTALNCLLSSLVYSVYLS
jgi:hypothetical protein